MFLCKFTCLSGVFGVVYYFVSFVHCLLHFIVVIDILELMFVFICYISSFFLSNILSFFLSFFSVFVGGEGGGGRRK